MARRRSRGITYPEFGLDGTTVVLGVEGGQPPKPTARQSEVLKKLPAAGWKLVFCRLQEAAAKKDTAVAREDVEKLINRLGKRISGGRFRSGLPIKVQRIVVMGRVVKDARLMLAYLGRHAQTVKAAVHLPISELMSDPDKWAKLVAYITRSYGSEMASRIELTLSFDEVEKLQKAGKLGEVPDGAIEYTPISTRILVDPVT